MRVTTGIAAAGFALLLSCRGAPPGDVREVDLGKLIDSLMPAVEAATGLTFTATPATAVRSRDEVHRFLLSKLQTDFPEERVRGVTAAYRLLGLLPDTLDLRQLILDLYTEQVAGYYDPDSLTLYGVAGTDPTQTRLIMAHELVHALQHQYLKVDSLMHIGGDADRLAASQAVLEGHATLASLKVLVPGQDVGANPAFWDVYREQVRAQQSSMAVFSSAPLILREGLIFPYLGGAEFMRWWADAHPGETLPKASEIPVSTEQVLFPTRYAGGDMPITVRFADSTDTILYEDTIGEFELQILATVARGQDQVTTPAPTGWGGDRYRVYESPDGPAFVWCLVWDTPIVAQRFQAATGIGAFLSGRARDGYRTAIDRVEVGGQPAHRVVIAPTRWSRWASLPTPVAVP